MYNSLLHEWFDQVWNRGNTEAVHRMMAPNAVIHNLAQDGQDSRGPDEFLAFFQKFRNAFPDMHVTVHDTVTQGDIEAGRWTVTGSHTGPGLGFAATNRQVTLAGMSMLRAHDGRVAEAWNVWDVFALYTQLGFAISPPMASSGVHGANAD